MGNWGPSHQTSRRGRATYRRVLAVILVLALLGIGTGGTKGESTYSIVSGAVALTVIAAFTLPRSIQRGVLARLRYRNRRVRPKSRRVLAKNPLLAVRERALQTGGGTYLGVAAQGDSRHARAERAALVLGPPRSGKTSAVMIPALIAHTGPAVSTSTKTDVADATRQVRSRDGRVWVFDPTGAGGRTAGEELRWSPVQPSVSWDGSMLMARAMTANIGSGTTDRSHWSNRAQALLGPLLHAAAVHGREMATVVDWVMRHELDEAGVLLEDERCSQLAFNGLIGIHHTEDRERSSIFSATADALQAYTSEHALDATRDPNFDPAAFVHTADTVYIHAPAEEQAAAAPIVCGLLAEIRRHTYRTHANNQPVRGRMLFALDEAANIAPLQELPQIASEGGSQGLLLLAAFQDLSQARQRWSHQADGFLTLFGTKLILPGVADSRTLEAVSTMLGDYDRQVIAQTRPAGGAVLGLIAGGQQRMPQRSTTYSTQRTRMLSPGDIAGIPAGQALHLDGVEWELITLTPAHAVEPWRTLTVASRAR